MNCIIFYHSSRDGYKTIRWVGEFNDAREWFERQYDLRVVTFCGVALEAAVIATR